MKSEGIMRFVVTKGKEEEERRYEFMAPLGSPFGETHDALYEVLEEVLSMAKKRSEELQKRRKEEEIKADDSATGEPAKEDGVPHKKS